MCLLNQAITDTDTSGQSANGNPVGSPTTPKAASNSSKLATVRGPNEFEAGPVSMKLAQGDGIILDYPRFKALTVPF